MMTNETTEQRIAKQRAKRLERNAGQAAVEEKALRRARRDVRERVREIEARAKDYRRQAAKYQGRADRLEADDGDQDRIDQARAKAGVYDARYIRAQREIARLKPHASRAHAAEKIAGGAVLVSEARRRREEARMPKTDRERAHQAKVERAAATEEAARRAEMAQANATYDARTMTGRREYHRDNLGGSKRVRSLRYDRLFAKQGDATPERVTACQRFHDLWDDALTGDFPPPKFEPGVDGGRVGGGLPGAADSKLELSRLRRSIGEETVAILWARVVMNFRFAGMAATRGSDARRMAEQFVAASDAAARFFGLVTSEESRLVRQMRQAMAEA